MRGFNRELLVVTFEFKKDVHDYLGFPSSPLSPAISHLSSFGDPMRNSFRMVLQKIGNPLDPLPNHHFQTFLSHYTKWQIYRDHGGSMSLYGYVQNSPADFDIYLANAKAQDPSFLFNPLHDNDQFFGQRIDYVFVPTGFDLHAFEILIKDKRMRSFSIAAAGQYTFDVNVFLQALTLQLEPLNTSDLLKVVSNYVSPPTFQKFLLPPNFSHTLINLRHFMTKEFLWISNFDVLIINLQLIVVIIFILLILHHLPIHIH
jgi:hypothetical protein